MPRRDPRPGQVINIGGGRSLHAHVAGRGGPTVVLEAGFPGSFGVDWHFVLPMLADRTTVLSYDRAGIGSSPADPRPVTTQGLAEDLNALAEALSLPAPLILVGHSGGALLVRAFRHLYPALVGGIVLIDPSHEQQITRIPAARMAIAQMRRSLKRRAWLARIGALAAWSAALGKRAVSPARRHLPPDLRRMVAAIQASRRYTVNALREVEAIVDLTGFLKGRNPTLGKLPLAVLSAGRSRPPEWAALQAEIAELSSNSMHRTLPDIGHDIPLEAPSEVARTVHDIVERIRKSTCSSSYST